MFLCGSHTVTVLASLFLIFSVCSILQPHPLFILQLALQIEQSAGIGYLFYLYLFICCWGETGCIFFRLVAPQHLEVELIIQDVLSNCEARSGAPPSLNLPSFPLRSLRVATCG